ncbi:CLUMA_CG001828, isoform A [Clunio marinus]|uniref:CLUMA_CG001828, isoform A n=1 Tax=Clunio marinus TaxID=568069 RepID=A0A1J1HKI8_9DIPT|nr:CLUMA_CG001828, isoform A [Clunio marinus]
MSSVVRIPIRTSQQQPRRRQGIKIGCCRVCTCLHLEFLTTKCGLLKIFELLLGSCCETLLIRFGMAAASDMGEAFYSFHSTVSACLTTTLVLLISYIFSVKTYGLMRQSIFEVFFNSLACCLYISASSYLGFATNVWLYPRFISSSSDTAFPAMTCVYYVGSILAIVYGMDAFVAYKEYKGYS